MQSMFWFIVKKVILMCKKDKVSYEIIFDSCVNIIWMN